MLAVMAVAQTGCGGSTGGEFPTTPVTIKVIYKGEPVSGASVTLVNSNDYSKPVLSVGKTDDQGNAIMKTYNPGDGAVKGVHLIMVSKYEASEAPPAASIDSPDYDPNVQTASAPKSLLPARFASPGSGLTLTVADSAVSHEVDLGS